MNLWWTVFLSDQKFKHAGITLSRDVLWYAGFLWPLRWTSQHHRSHRFRPRPRLEVSGDFSRPNKVYVYQLMILIRGGCANLCFISHILSLCPVFCPNIYHDYSCCLELSLTLRRKIYIDKPPDDCIWLCTNADHEYNVEHRKVILRQILIPKTPGSSTDVDLRFVRKENGTSVFKIEIYIIFTLPAC